MTEKQHALYRYLTLWADFTPAEARKYIESGDISTVSDWRQAAIGSIESSMEQDKNRRAA